MHSTVVVTTYMGGTLNVVMSHHTQPHTKHWVLATNLLPKATK